MQFEAVVDFSTPFAFARLVFLKPLLASRSVFRRYFCCPFMCRAVFFHFPELLHKKIDGTPFPVYDDFRDRMIEHCARIPKLTLRTITLRGTDGSPQKGFTESGRQLRVRESDFTTSRNDFVRMTR